MPKKKIENNYIRHKCSGCGRVRFEKFMKKYNAFHQTNLKTRFGNIMWVCDNNSECQQQVNKY